MFLTKNLEPWLGVVDSCALASIFIAHPPKLCKTDRSIIVKGKVLEKTPDRLHRFTLLERVVPTAQGVKNGQSQEPQGIKQPQGCAFGENRSDNKINVQMNDIKKESGSAENQERFQKR